VITGDEERREAGDEARTLSSKWLGLGRKKGYIGGDL